MDPSIIQILDDDEDETIHSGADVEAFTATSQALESDSVASWKTSSQDEVVHDSSHQSKDESDSSQQHSQHTAVIEPKQHNSGADGQQQQVEQISLQYPQQPPGMRVTQTPVVIREQGRMHNPENNVNHLRITKVNDQPVANTNHNTHVPFAMVFSILKPELTEDKVKQVCALLMKLKKNEIPKEEFLKQLSVVVEPEMFKTAVKKIKDRLSTDASQASGRQSTMRMPPTSATQGIEPRPNSHGVQVSQTTSSDLNKTDREHSTTPVQGGFNKQQQQQHMHFPQTSFPTYGSSGGSVHHSMASLKQQGHDSQMRQAPVHQSTTPAKIGGSTQAMSMMSTRPNSVNSPIRAQGGPFSHLKNNPTSSSTNVKPEPADEANRQQHKSQSSIAQGLPTISGLKVEQGSSIAGALMDEFTKQQSSRANLSSSMPNQLDSNTSLVSRMPSGNWPAGGNSMTPTPLPPKKLIVGHKKPIEGLGSTPLSSKKQKVSGGFLNQSIEQLNDVTAVSGVNLREEEEQLFSGPKEDSRASVASRRFVQEEEERLFLQKAPLQKKLGEIMVKCGVKGLGKDVERCLSLSVEERIRGLMSNFIRTSKQRIDVEKSRHQTCITSDVRHQILMVNRKAREEWERKQAEAEKLRKLSEPDDITGTDGDKEKDDGRGKALKVNKEQDDKKRATAANVAARAAVGGDDMLSKWQLMAEQARQKREGTNGSPSSCQPSKETGSAKGAKDNQELEKRGYSSTLAASGGTRKFGRNQGKMIQTKVARNITVKDVIAVLEREPQMSKSILIYRLYSKMRA